MRNTKLLTMLEGAIIAVIAFVLSYVPLQTANAALDLSLGLIPLGVYALRRGLGPGLAAGLIWGLLLILFGKAYILSLPQVILEYPIAFAFGGFGGIFSGRLRKALSEKNQISIVLTVVFAGIAAAVARWFFHYWAGVIFWGSYAPEGMSPFLYSFIANGTSAAMNAAMLAIISAIMVLLKFRKEFARRPYTTLSEISDFMKVTAMRESSD
ncbi:MAG: energy-coupled thiamine transporter ThiT [Clostridiales Family XIII bacterium]|jgi:thiamine transporter|nr:energy-coupled thiamine transporter ThiT [Clostridiales Family XIII bacterium]